MDDNIKKQIEHLSKVFGGDKIVSASDIAEVLKGLKSILDTYKKDTAELNQETREMVENAIDNIKVKYDELVIFVDEDIATKKGKLSEESTTIKEQISNELETLNSKISDVKDFLKEVKADEIFTEANSIQEFGYDPRSLTKSQLTDIWKKANKLSTKK